MDFFKFILSLSNFLCHSLD
uniref:Uncharacterized protein n=1 Tax=Anguilla anguilla TaxID=7936 RepID=A0A0E9QZ26_ANGAN